MFCVVVILQPPDVVTVNVTVFTPVVLHCTLIGDCPVPVAGEAPLPKFHAYVELPTALYRETEVLVLAGMLAAILNAALVEEYTTGVSVTVELHPPEPPVTVNV